MTYCQHFPWTCWCILCKLTKWQEIYVALFSNWYLLHTQKHTNPAPVAIQRLLLKHFDEHLVTNIWEFPPGIFINFKAIPFTTSHTFSRFHYLEKNSLLPHNTRFLQLDNRHQQTQHHEHQTNLSQILQNHTDEQIPEK